MSTFSEVFRVSSAQIESLVAMPEPGRRLEDIFDAAAINRGLNVEEAGSLIAWGRDPNLRPLIHAAAERVRREVAPPTVEFVIPVYLTSFCQNECLYCGYRESNALAERVRLSLDEFSRELDLILSWGHRQIELVLSRGPGVRSRRGGPLRGFDPLQAGPPGGRRGRALFARLRASGLRAFARGGPGMGGGVAGDLPSIPLRTLACCRLAQTGL